MNTKRMMLSMGKYENVVRILAFLSALLMLTISGMFSVDGFNFEVPGNEWAGYVLAFVIIVIEIVWNRPNGKNSTIWVAGILCYIYGIVTNVTGILVARGGADGIFDYVLPIVIGVFLEVVPEPLLVWAILNDDKKSDPISNLRSPGRRTPMNSESDAIRRLRESNGITKPDYNKRNSYPVPKYPRNGGK